MAENKRPSMEEMLASIREEYKNSGFADEFAEFETWEEMIPCSDGVKLRTIFYRPKTDKALPTIVQRCCYPHNEGMIRVRAEELCKKGFACKFSWHNLRNVQRYSRKINAFFLDLCRCIHSAGLF